ncbi:MAG: IS66 family insertion sequence element accessory protein TnpB, partial [Proteobacteria bacterium]|nr:IS66 family insertion sequence element accessory protein TnpB [Pseudomonadota bacterium]
MTLPASGWELHPVDMRGSFDALAGAVRCLGLDPVDGHLYFFLNKRRGTLTADAEHRFNAVYTTGRVV